MSPCGACQAWTASRLAWRALASSNAKVSESAQWSRSPMPITTCRWVAAVSSRTTTTGPDAWLAAYRLTEPSTIAVKAPRPREPTTSISAPAPASVTAWAGCPLSWSVSISRPGAVLAARSAAAARAPSRSLRRTSVTVSYSDSVGPARETIRGSSVAADTIRSGAPRSMASLAAQSTARNDSSEPSVPATMGFEAIASPPWRTRMRRVVLGTSFAHCHHDRAPCAAARAFRPYLPGLRSRAVTRTGRSPDRSASAVTAVPR